MKNEILESLRPWDCEIFDKDPCSPFICYGGKSSPPALRKPHFVAEIQKQAQGGADQASNNWEGGKKAMASNIEGGKRQLAHNAREYGGGAIMNNLTRGLTTGLQATQDFVGGFGEDVKRFGRGLLNIPEGGGGGDTGSQASSANYSGSKKKGKQASSQEGIMGKKKERLQKRDALKVKKKQG
tara:strand:+ start:946 stop:1494 length:549 start_codon:yes stop_codon:yes gene_type:complete